MVKAKAAKKMARAVSKASSPKKTMPSPLAGIASRVTGLAGGFSAPKGVSRIAGYRRRRVTPEKLQKQILILKLKKKLARLKYGGR